MLLLLFKSSMGRRKNPETIFFSSSPRANEEFSFPLLFMKSSIPWFYVVAVVLNSLMVSAILVIDNNAEIKC